MIVCTHCGRSNRPGAYYCKYCGRSVVCPRCRLILDEPASYCDNCGQALLIEAMTGTAQAAGAEWQVRSALPREAEQFDEIDSPVGQEEAFPDTARAAAGPAYLDQFIPQELMVKLEAARSNSGMVNERRVVTMLFCDVKGSTAAAEQLDPEEWTEIINGGLEFMIRSVYKYEGTVARLMGDAILAFFGAPLAHEDDPRRAVLAGLDMLAGLRPYREQVKAKWGIDFNARVGINTGLVVVGTVGSDLRMEYTAMGDAINLASRMEQTAEPGTVQITEHTYKLVSRFFEVEALGGIKIKGKKELIPSYRVLRPREFTGRPGLSEEAVSLVGREKALEKLSEVMEQVQLGSGQIVTIIGEEGLGKSRLIEELYRDWAIQLAESALKQDENAQPLSRWYNAFSLSYESTQPYGLFRHLLRQACGANIADPPEALQEKLETFISAIMPAEKQAQALTTMESLFGLGQKDGSNLEGETFKRLLYDTVSLMVGNWASDTPGVIVYDDLQWADPASVDLLIHLFKLIDSRPLLLICALRPDRRSAGWQIRAKADQAYPHRYTEITLEPLSQEDSQKLISRSLNNDQLPDSLVETILMKAAGNPYFIEEVVRALIDRGSLLHSDSGDSWQVNPEFEIKQLTIPDSLQSTLIARIDRLNESQKRILQLASVIGRSFYYRVLEDISTPLEVNGGSKNGILEKNLGDLQRMDLISQTARMPELVYIFRQALVQESAYKTILRKQRKEFHQKVGEAIEKLFANNLEEQAIILAHHFSEAGEDAKAVHYHTLAADAAYRLYANTEAVEHYSQALKFGTKASLSTDQLIHLYTNRGRALEISADIEAAVENYKAMRDQAEGLGSKKLELAALVSMATLYAQPSSVYNIDVVESLSDLGLKLAHELEDKAAEAKILWTISNVYRYDKDSDKALDLAERALTIARELDLREQIAYSLNDLSHQYNRIGQYDKSKEALAEANTLWRELNNLPMLTDGLSTASFANFFTGDYDRAITFSEEAWQISESIHNSWGLAYSTWTVGQIYWARGLPARAIKTMKDCIHFAEESGFVIAQIYTRSVLGTTYAELGKIAAGVKIAQKALQLSTTEIQPMRPISLLHMAKIHLINGDLESAEENVRAMREGNMAINLSQPDMITIVECEIPFWRGEYQKAIILAEKRLAELHKSGLNNYLPETYYLLGRAQEAAGQLDEALLTLEEAYKLTQKMQARWFEWQIMSGLASLTTGDVSDQWRERARETVEFISDNIDDAELKESFLKRPGVRELVSSIAASS